MFRTPLPTPKSLMALGLVVLAGCGGGGAGGGANSAPVVTAPAVLSHPQSATAPVGQPAAFAVSASGTSPLAYQWRKAGSPIPGATSAGYAIPAVQASDAGVYDVVVSNSAGSATSNGATLAVLSAPAIALQPQNRSVVAPAAATFAVTASGTEPLAYQWKRNGTDLPGATSASYSTGATSLSDDGATFTVQVSNAYGSVLSGAATLSVTASAGLDLSIPTVYLTQSTQTLAFDVPLVKDRAAMLRAFVVANRPNSLTPAVRARFYDAAGTLVQTYSIPAPGASVPTAVDESSLANSWNVAVPAAYLQAGTKLLVDVDPTGAVAESDRTNNTWPASGLPQTLNVQTLPPFRVTLWSVQTGDGRAGNVSSGSMASFTSLLEKMWPIGLVDRAFGGAFTTSVGSLTSTQSLWTTVLNELDAKRVADGSTRHYHGIVNPAYASGIAGLAYVPGRTAIVWDKSAGYADSGQYPGVYAHEVGHNFSLDHAPCNVTGDPSYPYSGGFIGQWGTDASLPALKSPSTYHDIMGYCSTVWVSDYTYRKALAYRQSSQAMEVPAAAQPGLLLWGRLEDGEATLEPAFALPMVPAYPEAVGDHLLEARDAQGKVLLAVPFALQAVGCGQEGRSGGHFALAIPFPEDRLAELQELRWSRNGEVLTRRSRLRALLAHPQGSTPPTLEAAGEGRVRLRWNAGLHAKVLVRDPETGQTLGFGTSGEMLLKTSAKALEVHLSDGLASRPQRVQVP